jgi:hypothetical protein
VRNVQELAVALRLWEGHEPWHTKVPEDLRFVVKGLMSSLSKMQQQAALWIIGVFRTSPIGG